MQPVTKHALPAVVGLMAIGAGVFFSSLSDKQADQFLVEQWLRELSTLPEEQIPPRIDKTATQGERGLSLVVEALASRRECVTRAARGALHEQLNRWLRGNSVRASAQVARLAKMLAERAGRLSPSGQRVAADVATWILVWPVDPQAVDSERLLADCELVLRSGKTREPTALTGDDASSGVAERVPLAGLSSPASPEPPPTLPGGGLPLELVRIPSLSAAGVVSLGPDRRPELLAPPPPLELKRASPHPSQPDLDDNEPLRLLDDLEVIVQLRSASDLRSSKATNELVRRGYRPEHLRLARQLVDPDPEVRRKLAETLPRVAGVDVRAWLLWLSEDEHRDVRLAAVTIMATTNDAVLQTRLRALSLSEADARIREQLERVVR